MNKNTYVLEKYGYETEPLLNDTIANGRNFPGDYRNQSIKRLKLVNCNFHKAKFDNAAVTGSSFTSCLFTKCKMDQGDFEYCDFYDSDITSKKPISIAFDNSNFIDSRIYDLTFYSSTFGNAFFEQTKFKQVTFQNCTLEATSFHHCFFNRVDFIDINLDYAEFKAPHFEGGSLPMSQIVYTFGLIQYLMSTDDQIDIVGKNGKVTPKEYISTVLPALLEFYLNVDDEKKVTKYFPLINILLAYGRIDEADSYLELALSISAKMRDLRMIKHYCKLISNNDCYTLKLKRKIYKKICNLFQPSTMTPWDLKNYSRHIGDIKYILLTENNLPTIYIQLTTNIVNNGLEKIGLIIRDIFHISDRYISGQEHNISFEIQRNSPVSISIQFTEIIENIVCFLKDITLLTCQNIDCVYPQKLLENVDINYALVAKQNAEIADFIHNYDTVGLQLSFSDFYIENWKYDYNERYHSLFFFGNSLGKGLI